MTKWLNIFYFVIGRGLSQNSTDVANHLDRGYVQNIETERDWTSTHSTLTVTYAISRISNWYIVKKKKKIMVGVQYTRSSCLAAVLNFYTSSACLHTPSVFIFATRTTYCIAILAPEDGRFFFLFFFLFFRPNTIASLMNRGLRIWRFFNFLRCYRRKK